MIEMIKVMGRNKINMVTMNPIINCEVYEDNSEALSISKEHKYRPRTKHLNIKLHHLRQYVNNNEIDILPINTDDKPSDIFTNLWWNLSSLNIGNLSWDGNYGKGCTTQI